MNFDPLKYSSASGLRLLAWSMFLAPVPANMAYVPAGTFAVTYDNANSPRYGTVTTVAGITGYTSPSPDTAGTVPPSLPH